jgi:hypothetical protein
MRSVDCTVLRGLVAGFLPELVVVATVIVIGVAGVASVAMLAPAGAAIIACARWLRASGAVNQRARVWARAPSRAKPYRSRALPTDF